MAGENDEGALSPDGTIRAVLSADHERLDRMAAELERVGEQPSNAKVEELIACFERHFAQEETVLFPALELVSGQAGQHVAVLRAEHQLLRERLESLRDALDRGRAIGADVSALREEAGSHARKEAWVLYPLLDQVAGGTHAELLRGWRELTIRRA